MSSALIKAIHGALEGDPAIAALMTGGIHMGLALSGTPLPYLVWNNAGNVTNDFYTSHEQVELHALRFRAYALRSVTAVDAVSEIERLLVGAPPPLDEGTILQIKRETSVAELDPDLTNEGEEVWVATLQLAVMVQRNPLI